MSQRIGYFTAGAVPTSPELAEIEAIKDVIATYPPYVLLVRNVLASPAFGDPENPEAFDYVAGSPPTEYDEVPEFDPADSPRVVTLGDTLYVKNSAGTNHDATVIDDGDDIALQLPATKAVLANGAVLPVTGGGSVTLTIANGVVTGAAYTAP